MIPLNTKEVQLSCLIHSFQTNAILGVDWRFPQGQNLLCLAWSVVLKMFGLLWFNLGVLVVLDHDEVLQLVQVKSIGLILDSLLIIDFCNEMAFLYISIKLKRIMPVLGLDKDILDKLNISAVAEEIPDNVTEEEHLPRTEREAKNSLMLSSYSNQVLHGWTGTPLSYSSQKLTTLGEANSIITVLQFWIICHHLADLSDLSVGVPEESALHINKDIAANHDAVDIDTRHFFF